VTGASGGLGRALCDELLAAGARVSALDIDAAALDAMVADDESGRLHTQTLDITDAEACVAVFEALRDQHGPVDLLVNNAGITHFSTVADVSTETVGQVMAVNFMGAVACTKAALPDLLARRGQVAVLSSVAGFAPLFGRCAYSASKHALHGFFETLRSETREQGVNVLMVCPSFIATQPAGSEAKSPYAGAARPGSAHATVGDVMPPSQAAREIVAAIQARKTTLLVGRVARQSYWLRRLWPGIYDTIMTRQARREVGA
jgi:NAD(P)-dependent dehydrogenase (short-subunit alcohol dehydrogenase family)